MKESQRIREKLKREFDVDVTGINGLRCLVLIGKDEEILSKWSTAMVAGGPGEFHTFLDLLNGLMS